jgi:acetyltransferase
MGTNEAFTKIDLRERARRFLDFRNVAVVGASDDPSRIGGKPLTLFRTYGFTGEVYGVNPKYKEVQGYACVPTVDALPNGIELAIVAVAAPLVPETLESLGRKGVQAATVFSSGFAEIGPEGVQLQRRMTEVALRYGIAVNGPNCVGTLSFTHGRPATFSSSLAVLSPGKVGRVALVSQSGGFATNIWADAVLAGAGFSHLFSTGNEAVLGFGDYLMMLAEDPDTDVVLGYVEGVADGVTFCAGAEALRRAGKPLALLKSGRSAEVAPVVASHTGQMAGNHEAYRAAFRKHGVIEVETLEDLIDHARLLPHRNLSDPISIATTSGGTGIYLADLCVASGVKMATLSAKTEKRLHEIVPSFGTTKNPVDLTAQVVNDSAGLERALVAMLEDEETRSLLFVLIGKAEEDKAREVVDIVSRVQRQTNMQVPIAWLGVPQAIRAMGSKGGLDVFSDPARVIKPLSSMRRWTAQRELRREPPPADAPGAKPTLQPERFVRSAEGLRVLDEWDGLALLERYGLDVPSRWRIESGRPFDEQAHSITFPCVAKRLAPVVLHKTRVGGVVTNIRSMPELRAAWGQLQAGGATAAIVEEQVQSIGPELLLGIAHDATFRQRLVIGGGGVYTNDENDFVTLIPPLDPEYVESALRGLRIWRRLEVAMQKAPALLSWIYDAAQALCRLHASEGHALAEIECNPVLITVKGLVPVDAVAIGG